MNKKTKRIIIAVIIVGILSLAGSFFRFITDYIWFDNLNYSQTFLTKFKSQLVIGIPMFVCITLVFYIFSRWLFRKNKELVTFIEIEDDKHKNRIKKISILASGLISLFITVKTTSNLWFEILQMINSTSFGVADPVFNNDVSFYVFILPMLKTIVSSIITVLIFMIVIAFLSNIAQLLHEKFQMAKTRRSGYEDENMTISNFAIDKNIILRFLSQITILGSILLIAIGVSIWLGNYDILYSASGRVFGAGYTDFYIDLNVRRVTAIICFASAITFIIGSKKKNLKITFSLPLVAIAFMIIGNIVGFGVEKLVVEPDQLSKENEFLLHSINFTQEAYGLKNVEEHDFDVKNNLTAEDLINNQDVIENIRINDQAPLKQIYNKLQGIRPYYVFNDADMDRYTIDGKYQQVYLATRELDQTLLNEKAKTWVNQYLKYTHGYGITLNRVNEVTSQGQPKLLVKDIPPVTNTDINITRPEIYFGEKTNGYVVVNSDEKEFDYPAGSNNVETIYEANAGIELTFFNKLLFAMREGSYNLLISGNVNSDSRILVNRNIIERIKTIAPYIQYDSDPYIAIDDETGELFWIIEGYTVSNLYPYSQPIEGSTINYIRNSVKVVVSAYTGEVNYYIIDENDPIVMTYSKIFKDLFKPISEMPEGLKKHIRYSRDMFNIQAQMYRTFHMENTTVFFGREDYWDISKEKYMSGEKQVTPNYYMFKLPEEDELEFLLTVPYTPQGKDNMSALLVARNDGDKYGQLMLYKFPKNMTISGTALIESKIDQNTDISSQLTLWSQKGSNVLRGNTLIIPIAESLLYVEPIYLQADTESNFPEMKMVVVAYGDEIVMESSLDKALNKILGKIYDEDSETTDNSTNTDETDTDKDDTNNEQSVEELELDTKTIKELVTLSNQLLNEANDALKDGDFALYGEKLEQLEATLSKLADFTNEVE